MNKHLMVAFFMIMILIMMPASLCHAEEFPILQEQEHGVYLWLNADASGLDDGFFPSDEGAPIRYLVLPSALSEFYPYINVQLSALEGYYVTPNNEFFQVRDGVLFSKDSKRLLAYPQAKQDKEYYIPEGVQWVEKEAFAKNSHLEKIYLPSTLQGILAGAFEECCRLQEITLNEGLRILDDRCFESCKALTMIYLPSTVQVIGFAAFRYSGLMQIELNDGLIYIGGEAFAYCATNKLNLYLAPSVVSIDAMITYDPFEITLYPDTYADIADFYTEVNKCYIE